MKCPEAEECISLRFSLFEKDKVIEVNAKAVWVNEAKGNEETLFKGFGVHFTKIDPEDRGLISKFVQDELVGLEKSFTTFTKSAM